MKDKKIFGLIGKSLKHSFSKKYFENKFKKLGLTSFEYKNFELDSIDKFPDLLKKIPQLKGLNVTIPYKEQIIEFIDELSPEAKKIKAVNTINITEKNGKKLTIGHNTDIYGFEKSLSEFIKKTDGFKALILGTGGASKAIAFVSDKLKIPFLFVSRNPKNNKTISYKEIDKKILSEYRLIINTTPLGMYPKTEQCPPLPYQLLTDKHYLFDLIYNPPETLFLQKGKQNKAKTKNGYDMLIYQAEKSWEIYGTN